MSFLDEAKRRIQLAAKAKESAEPDDAERRFRKGMAMVLESLDEADEKVVQELMTVLLDNLERRFAGKPQEQQAEPEQPAANAQRGPKTPDLESYFSAPTNKPGGSKIPDINSYFD
ncbi:hypothetical protein [Escherichia coli]|uniref:hypothetical protein n=1 Tax=Escherichia coli TaxID=562 RepID=UPI00191B3C3A|nr:hypothetical protein [Escherichia coli]CAD6182527.1 hypothetical protein QREC_QR363_04471 [Escherichia coli]